MSGSGYRSHLYSYTRSPTYFPSLNPCYYSTSQPTPLRSPKHPISASPSYHHQDVTQSTHARAAGPPKQHPLPANHSTVIIRHQSPAPKHRHRHPARAYNKQCSPSYPAKHALIAHTFLATLPFQHDTQSVPSTHFMPALGFPHRLCSATRIKPAKSPPWNFRNNRDHYFPRRSHTSTRLHCSFHAQQPLRASPIHFTGPHATLNSVPNARSLKHPPDFLAGLRFPTTTQRRSPLPAGDTH